MNPSELVKGCGKQEYNSFDMLHLCGQGGYYCEDCKARIEQALFENKQMFRDIKSLIGNLIKINYCNLDLTTHFSLWKKYEEHIEILEKALNIHSPQDNSKLPKSRGFADINNQGVKE